MSVGKKNDLDGRTPGNDVQRGCTCGATVGRDHTPACSTQR